MPCKRVSCAHCSGSGSWSTAKKASRAISTARRGTIIARPHYLIVCSRSMSKWNCKRPVTNEPSDNGLGVVRVVPVVERGEGAHPIERTCFDLRIERGECRGDHDGTAGEGLAAVVVDGTDAS